MRRRVLSIVLESLLFAVVAMAFAGGLRERFAAGPWLPIAFGSGIMTAWVLLRRDLLFVPLGIGVMLGRMQLGLPLLDAGIVGAAAVMHSAVVIAVLRATRADLGFQRPRDMVMLAGASLMGSLLRAAAENATAASFYGHQHGGEVFEFVALSQFIGTVLGLPAVLTVVRGGWARRLLRPDRQTIETMALLVLAVAIAARVFFESGAGLSDLRPMALAVIPLLLWITLRTGNGFGIVAVFLVVEIVALGTTMGRGPYSALGMPSSLLMVQTFGGALGLAAILVHSLEASRRNAQKALRDRESRLQRVLDASNDGIWEWTAADDRVEFNDRAARLLGFQRGTTARAAERSLDSVHPEDRARLTEALEAHVAGRTGSLEVEIRVGREETGWHWVLSRGRVGARDVQGRPTLVSGTLTDIQERKAADEERLSMEDRRLQSQKLESLGLLAGGVAHDFNNILTGVLGHADLARDELPAGSIARTHVDRVIDGARGAAELTRQMLAYAGHGRVESRLVDLAQLVAEMGHLLQVSISRRNRLRYQFAPALPQVEGDPAQLRQVVMNLILNAAEALDPRGGTIVLKLSAGQREAAELASVWIDTAPEAGGYVTLEVSDEGVGMDDATLARIFDPFFSTKFTGRGLGLAAVLGIVRAHRGTVQVESVPGRGTTFRVHLPAQVVEPAAAPSDPAGAQWAMSGPVLVVDDETPVRSLACAMLRRLGATPLPAANGAEAVQLAESQHGAIRLAFVDRTMPGMDGRATVAALRSRSPELAVVVMSGWHEPRWDDTLVAQPDAFLPKPFDLDSLAEAARTAMEARALAATAASPPVSPPRTP